MDDTKKALLSIDIDTAALTQNAANAKAAVAALADQLNQLKASGKDSGDAFDKVVEQLKKAGDAADKSKDALKEYGKGLNDAATASNNLKASSADLSAQHQKSAQDTTTSAASLDVLKQRYSASNTEVAALKQQFQALSTESITLKESHGKNSTEVKALQTSMLTLNAQIKNAKTNSLEYKQAIDQLSAQQSNNSNVVKDSGRSVSDYTTSVVHAIESHTPFGKSLSETAERFKTLKDGTGNVITSLSNYKDEVSATLAKSDTFNNSTSIFAKGFEVLKTGTSVATGGFQGLGSAIAGTGFGLLLTVLAAVIEHFKTFTPLVDACERITAGLNGAFSAMGNILGGLLEPFMKVFTEPKQAILDIGKFILDNIINRFKAVGLIINSILHPSLKGLADGFIQLNTGVTNGTDKMMAFAKGIGNAASQTAKLKGAQQELDRQIQTSTTKNAEDAAKIAANKAKMQTADLATRKKLQKENDDIEKAQTAEHRRQVDEQIRITTGKVAAAHNLSGKELANLSADSIEKLRVAKSLTAEEVKSLQEAVKQKAELRKQEAEKTLSEHQANETKRKATYATAKKTKKQNQQETIKDETQLVATIAAIKTAGDKTEIKATSDALNGNLKIEAAVDNKSLQFKKALAKEKLKLVLQEHESVKDHFGKLAGLFAKNTEASKAAFAAQKAIAVAEIAINTEKQVSASISATKNQIADDSKLGFPLGTILVVKDISLGVIDVASTIANGAKQVSSINSTNVQGFARGGMYLSDGYGTYVKGPGSGTSDSINAKLSNGESIINARSTEMFAPILSAINQAGGGRAFNTANPGSGYALGGIFSGSNSLNDSSSDLANARSLNDMAKTMAANMPRQILVVEDVQASLQNKAMLQNMSNF